MEGKGWDYSSSDCADWESTSQLSLVSVSAFVSNSGNGIVFQCVPPKLRTSKGEKRED